MGLFRKRTPPRESEGFRPEVEEQQSVRQFRELLADRIGEYQEGRIEISDEAVQTLRAGQVFLLGEDRLDSVANDAKLFLNTLSHSGYLARMQEVELTEPAPDDQREALAAKIYEVSEEAESVQMGVANMAYIFAVSDVEGDEAPANLLHTLGAEWLDEISASMTYALTRVYRAGATEPVALVEPELLEGSFRYGYFVRLCEEAVPSL
jgi:hypothetical protein